LSRQVSLVEFFIRPAVRDDFPAIRSLIQAVKINPTGLVWKRFLVAKTLNGDLLGCGQIKQHTDGSWEIASIAVQEQARGLGVARAVIETLLVLEPQRPLHLMCRSHLKSLYKKFGFHPIELKEMPSYFQRISFFERIFNSKSHPDNRLMVMRLE
jgi:N-acetylglutamate synthase-like GNAT family acetyltransferase